MNKKVVLSILSLFVIWKTYLFLALIAGFLYIPLFSSNFLGGGERDYNFFSYTFPWANFDGEHYTSIASSGYKSLELAFFPVYPKLISFFVSFFPDKLEAAIFFGLLISNVLFLGCLFFLYKLLRLDYSEKISFGVLFTLTIFPMSFYFQSAYNESLFLFLTIGSFYFARKKNWLVSGLFGLLASATRVWGILLLPAILIEAWQQKALNLKVWPILLIPFGLLSYMVFLGINYNDPLAFYNLQLVVGEQHQRGIVTLPQVFYRYVKILTTVDIRNSIYQTVLLEFFTGLLFLLLPIYGYFRKIRWSYLFFALAGFLLPTVQGSFSSLPRYVLVLFPSFIALFLLIDKTPKVIKIVLMTGSVILLGVETILFIRGYWVA